MSADAKRQPRLGNTLPLPPGGREVLDAIRNQRRLNTFIVCGTDAWNRHKLRVDRVVLPPDASPDEFDWGIFRGQSPTVLGFDDDHERLKRLAWLLLRAGAKLICVLYEDAGVTRAVYFRNG